MKTVFLHIGAGKTGTTAIQNCLSSNSELLKRNGVLFPKDPYFLEGPEIARHYAPLSCGNGIQLFYYLTAQPWFDSNTFLDILDNILSDSYRAFIFSCEILQYGFEPQYSLLHKFLIKRDIQLKIVYSVRDIAAHALSSWRQLVIYDGETLDWSKFLSKYAADKSLNTFDSTLRMLSETVRQENIIVLNYSKLGRRVTECFFDLFEEDYAKYQPAGLDNPSDDDLTIDTMLQFNKLIAPLIDQSERKATSYKFYKTLSRAVQAIPNRRKSGILLSPHEYHELTAALQPRLDFVNNNFLVHEPIVVARPEQVGKGGRHSNRSAARLAKRIAVGLAGELPSLAVARRLPVGPIGRFASLMGSGRSRVRQV